MDTETRQINLIPPQTAVQRLLERQSQIAELELHANGHAAHIGKLSPGCLHCFTADRFYTNFAPAQISGISNFCQRDCDYCQDDKTQRVSKVASSAWWKFDTHKVRPKMPLRKVLLADAFANAGKPPNKGIVDQTTGKVDGRLYPSISFSGMGEPTLHLEVIEQYIKFYRTEVDPVIGKHTWVHLYTNGLSMTRKMAKQCVAMGVDEIRFHLGASDFSEKVYKNLEIAIRYFGTVSVETPLWPPHREKLFEMLPRIDELGVKHLNLGQVEMNKGNRESLLDAYPEGRWYPMQAYQLYESIDLFYDLLEEYVKNDYSYSILSCDGFVKQMQRAGDYGVRTKDVAIDDVDLENLADFAEYEKARRKAASDAGWG